MLLLCYKINHCSSGLLFPCYEQGTEPSCRDPQSALRKNGIEIISYSYLPRCEGPVRSTKWPDHQLSMSWHCREVHNLLLIKLFLGHIFFSETEENEWDRAEFILCSCHSMKTKCIQEQTNRARAVGKCCGKTAGAGWVCLLVAEHVLILCY